MSDSGRKRDSYYRDKELEPEHVRFNADRNSSRRSADDDDDHHINEARPRSRATQNNHNSYYSEQDETMQQFYHRSGSRSNSRSRSPVYRPRRDAGSYDRYNKPRTREYNKRGGDQGSDYGWEDNKIRKPRETKYHTDDFREERAKGKCARSFNYSTDDGASDPRLTRHRSIDGEGEFRRSSDIPCKFFAGGFCRNGKHCRFSHHGAERKQPQDKNNNFYHRQDNNNPSGHDNNKWNDVERLDDGNMEASRASKRIPESKGNDGSSWIDNMEMSPEWNYPIKEDQHGVGIIQPRVLEDNTATDHNNPVNIAPVQAFNQNRNALLYQSSLTSGGSQQVVGAADLPLSSNLSNLESGKVYQDNHHSIVEKPVPVQNTVTKEQIDQISSISATIAQFFANGQPIPQLQQASQMTIQPNQATTTALHTQSNSMSNNSNQLWGHGASTGGEGVPVVSNIAGNPKACEENGDKKTVEASKKEEQGEKTGQDTNDAENVEDDDENEDDGSDEENKKGKDPKGMRAFKFALVEIVKELLKPAWKEGKMKKDGYKNIVKKVVEKVTGTMQTGSVPQTQEKIDLYLTASKPKLTKLVQAYISKVKKS